MDVVIPLGRSTAGNYTELRYCLRSLERFFPDLGDVVIVGEKPSWITRVIHLPEGDQIEQSAKERNIFRKICKAVVSPLVSDDFLYCNDDHFLLQPWTEEYHHKGTLTESVSLARSSNNYQKTLANTLAFLGGGFNFDTHCPITVNKQKFIDSVGSASWYVPYGFGIKSLYCNLNEIDGKFYPDLKIHQVNNFFKISDQLSGRKYFSSTDGAANSSLQTLLLSLYPNKSVYEKD